jgi:acetyl esterase/lipase
MNSSAAKQNNAPRITPVSAPAIEAETIPLRCDHVSDMPEAWERMEEGLPPGAVAGTMANFGGPELWLRNVSQPTLTPFPASTPNTARSAMIVVPGGAFMGLAIDREGYSVAKWLNQRGITAFLLKHRVESTPIDPYDALADFRTRVLDAASRAVAGSTTVTEFLSDRMLPVMTNACADGIEALRFVREHASDWGLSPQRIGMVGFSAGAAVALDVTLKSSPAARPDLLACIYGLLPGVVSPPAGAPPMFVAAAANDAVLAASQKLYQLWRAASAPVELHIHEDGGHGFGILSQGTSSDQWVDLFDHWLTLHGFR